MTPDNYKHLRVDLEEVAPGEFFIAVRLQDKKITSLYLRGDRQYANECLEVARRRILLATTCEVPNSPEGKVLQELMRLRRSPQASAE